MVSWALAWSGCAKIVRRVAATICWASLGTVASALRMKWTRQRQAAPTKTWATACLRPRWESEMTNRMPLSPRLTSLAQELEPELVVLGRTDIEAHHLAFARGADPDRDQHRHRDHPAVLAHLLEGGVQEQVGELAVQAPGPEGVDLGVELLADPADLVFGDAVDAQRLGEVVDRPGADAVDVGFLDHREQRPLVPAARFQQARKVGALAELGDLQLERPDPGVPLPLPVAVAVGRPTRGALVRLGAD